jgi:hypothetical protein
MQMATLHVRNVPDDLYELLRERAAANDRSIGAETIQLLHERLALAGSGRAPRRFPMPGRRRPSGPGMFTRFTTEARQVVVAAQEHARELGHDHVGTEHLLVGLLDVALDSPLGRALGELGLTPEHARGATERTSDRGRTAATGRIPFEPGTKQALELALREAVELGDAAIAPEHILLGILDQDTGKGAAILRGVEPDATVLRRCATEARRAFGYSFRQMPQPSFRVLLLEGDAGAWEKQLNEAAALGYDLLDIVDRHAILRRV